jgi:hypothetical protein
MLNESSHFKRAVVSALLCDNINAVGQMEIYASTLELSDETKGIANLLRDRAEDMELGSTRDFEDWSVV